MNCRARNASEKESRKQNARCGSFIRDFSRRHTRCKPLRQANKARRQNRNQAKRSKVRKKRPFQQHVPGKYRANARAQRAGNQRASLPKQHSHQQIHTQRENNARKREVRNIDRHGQRAAGKLHEQCQQNVPAQRIIPVQRVRAPRHGVQSAGKRQITRCVQRRPVAAFHQGTNSVVVVQVIIR